MWIAFVDILVVYVHFEVLALAAFQGKLCCRAGENLAAMQDVLCTKIVADNSLKHT